MNAMERLINGYFDLKEQTERDQSSNFAQLMFLNNENKKLKKDVAYFQKRAVRSNDIIEVIRIVLPQLVEDKMLTEEGQQKLLAYLKDIEMTEDEEEKDE